MSKKYKCEACQKDTFKGPGGLAQHIRRSARCSRLSSSNLLDNLTNIPTNASRLTTKVCPSKHLKLIGSVDQVKEVLCQFLDTGPQDLDPLDQLEVGLDKSSVNSRNDELIETQPNTTILSNFKEYCVMA